MTRDEVIAEIERLIEHEKSTLWTVRNMNVGPRKIRANARLQALEESLALIRKIVA